MSTRARAAVVDAPGAPFAVREVELGAPGPGEVLVRVVASGLCHTDLGAQAGGLPFALPGVLGHEGAGVVEAVGEGVSAVAAGDRVLMSFTSCGACAACAEGHPAYCSTWLPRNLVGAERPEGSAGVHLVDGSGASGAALSAHFFGQSSFATHAVADERALVRLDPSLLEEDLVALAPLGCGVLTGVGSVWNVLDPQPGAVVAVYGAGAVGLAGVMAAAMRAPSVLVAVDRVRSRLDLALELGATHAVDAATEDVPVRLAELTGGSGVQLSFDTTGSPAVARTALDAAAVRGTVLVCGAPPPGTEIGVDVQGILPGKVLRGVTMGDADPQVLVPQLVGLHAEGKLPLERLQRRYALEDAQQAAHDMHTGVTVKPVIVP